VSSSPVLDIESLIQPIPGANPAGVPLPDGRRLELDDLRKEADPLDPATAGRNPEWAKIVRMTSDLLTGSSKDLVTATRLLEAATKKDGVAGLRDGLRFLHRLAADCWDRLHPVPEEGEGFEVREGPMKWLNDIGRGARFPQTVAGLTLFRSGNAQFGYHDWLDETRKKEVEDAIPKTDPNAIRKVYAELNDALTALQDLARTLDEKMGADVAPDFLTVENELNLGTAIRRCISFVEEVAHRRGVPLKEGEAAAAAPTADSGSGSTVAAPSSFSVMNVANNREGLYRQVSQIAGALKVLEPHSPIPYLLDRCVRLGALPFPELMRAMIRENAALDELDRLIGVEKKED
jgi:type VI secretion system protein ImpA